MISWLGLLKLAIANLRINKLRSILTVLGMVFGTGAVIATLSSSEGASRFIQGELEKLGTNNVTIRSEGQTAILERDRNLILKYSNLFETLSFVDEVSGAQVRHLSRVREASLKGVDPIHFDANRLNLTHGRTFDNSEFDRFAMVAVLGHQAKKELFGNHFAVGKEIHIFIEKAQLIFQVAGVLNEKGGPTGYSIDNGVFIPRSTAQKLSPPKNRSSYLAATLIDEEWATRAKNQVLGLLKNRFPSGLQVSDAREAIDRTKGIWEKQNLVGLCLALISLLTGGVGIMNIMLLSVSQRRKEIGLRKAIGASNEVILLQFLLESVLICFLGGTLGIVAGMAFGQQVAKMMGQWDAAISLSTVSLALGFAVATGILFGLLPAIRASRLDPFDALRS